MKVVFDHDFPIGMKRSADRAVGVALAFMMVKHPDICFCDVTINFKTADYDSSYLEKHVDIAIAEEILFYPRKSCEYKTPRGGLKVGRALAMILLLVHELTHHVQYCEKRRASEVETNNNQIEYMRIHEPKWFKKLIKIKRL